LDRGTSILIIAAVEFLAAPRSGLKGRSPVFGSAGNDISAPKLFSTEWPNLSRAARSLFVSVVIGLIVIISQL